MIRGLHPDQFVTLIIRPVTQDLKMWTPAAERLLLGTAAVESALGHYLAQFPTGPARGPYQHEVETVRDIYYRYLAYRPELKFRVDCWKGPVVTWEQGLVGNLHYATALARVHYYRVPEPLPDANDPHALGTYYKQYWNTPLGKASVEQFVDAYTQLAKRTRFVI